MTRKKRGGRVTRDWSGESVKESAPQEPVTVIQVSMDWSRYTYKELTEWMDSLRDEMISRGGMMLIAPSTASQEARDLWTDYLKKVPYEVVQDIAAIASNEASARRTAPFIGGN